MLELTEMEVEVLDHVHGIPQWEIRAVGILDF